MFENPYLTYVVYAGIVATALMVVAMLYLVFISANDPRHRPSEKADEEGALEPDTESEPEPPAA